MILKTWVGPDGLVRWSKDEPDEQGYVRDDSSGVVASHTYGYTILLDGSSVMRSDMAVPDLGVALRLACDESIWEDT